MFVDDRSDLCMVTGIDLFIGIVDMNVAAKAKG